MITPPPHSTAPTLTLLHTSDWHLGRRLYGQMRYDEFEAFLTWLENTIAKYKVDVLIVAGDIFDTMTPSNRAQALYYAFLGRVSKSCCQHIVIVAGNHDSPTFLDAPSNVLKFLNVHVVGTACENLEDEVLTLTDSKGIPQCIITAVPYLRDRDVRSSYAGESADDKEAKVIGGIKAHYDSVANIAKAKQAKLVSQSNKPYKRHIPIIATGHLFAAGGRTTDDDGVRELYVGSLGKISADMFDDCFDYVALGHLHVPQKVGGRAHIRYSGSPIAMGFGEARQQKQVLLVQFAQRLVLPQLAKSDLESAVINDNDSTEAFHSSGSPTSLLTQSKSIKAVESISHNDGFIEDLFAGLQKSTIKTLADSRSADRHDKSNLDKIDNVDVDMSLSITAKSIMSQAKATVLHSDEAKQMYVVSVAVPAFQKLLQIKGNLVHIKKSINKLSKDESVWLEVIYDDNEIVTNFKALVDELIEDTPFVALKTLNPNQYNKTLALQASSETLQDLDELEVFERCMKVHEVANSQKDELREAYSQILYDIRHDDKRAE